MLSSNGSGNLSSHARRQETFKVVLALLNMIQLEVGCATRLSNRLIRIDKRIATRNQADRCQHWITRQDLLHRQGQAPALGIDLDDAHEDVIVLRHDLAGVLDVTLCQFGDVDEAFDTLQDLDECAKRDDLGGAAVHDVALLVALEDSLPRIGLGLLKTERDALTIAVHVEHLDLDLLADLEQLRRMIDMAPREFGDMDQTIDTIEVDEGAEVDDVRNETLNRLAGGEIVKDALTHFPTLFLEHGATREHNVVTRAIELNHFAAELLTTKLFEILNATDVDERGGQEAADAEIDDQAALDDLDDQAVNRLAALGRSLDALPRLLKAGALLGENQTTVCVLLRHHQRVDLFAKLDLVGRVNAPTDRELCDGDYAFALVANIDQDFVLVDAHDFAGDDVTLGKLRDRCVVVRHHLAVDFDPNAWIVGDHFFCGLWHR